jgi:nucleobase:cation symporter-1, NCS1 family
MCYVIYWTALLPFVVMSPQRIRYVFYAKAIIVPSAWLAIFIWSVIKVPTSISLEPNHSALSGNKLAWAWLSAFNSALGSYASLSVNIPDFTVSFTIFRTIFNRT